MRERSIRRLVIGIDVGTSGVRAVAMDAAGTIHAQASAAMADFGADHRDPAVWWAATRQALSAMLAATDPSRIRALAVDGTSGTMLAVDAARRAAGAGAHVQRPGRRCRNPRLDPSSAAPATSAAHGPTSGLAKLIRLQAHARRRPRHPSGRLDRRALFRPLRRERREQCAEDRLRPGRAPLARLDRPHAGASARCCRRSSSRARRSGGSPREPRAEFGLPRDVVVVAGTTDGCASFLATGAVRARRRR